MFDPRPARVNAVNDVSLELMPGETLGLVGESGCGKSTLARMAVGLLPPSSGEILLAGRPLDAWTPLERAGRIQMIFQDPFSSLDPRMTTLDIIAEPLRAFGKLTKEERKKAVSDLMIKVGLRPEYIDRYPHSFSGGQRQRIGIARAIALNPRFIVCDESLSSLDVSVQAQILDLLKKLKDEYNMSYLFIAHDLSVVKHLCDKVAVMYVGKIVETASTEELYSNPLHPYTEALLASVPKTTEGKVIRKDVLEGEVPDPTKPPEGCFFHTRCPYCKEECKTSDLSLIEVKTEKGTRYTTCIRYKELTLKGIEEKTNEYEKKENDNEEI
jgi:peptide/nickel transport system ATP-binding protein